MNRGALDGLRNRSTPASSEESVKVSHHRLGRRFNMQTLVMVPKEMYQSERNHQNSPIKNRNNSIYPPCVRIDTPANSVPHRYSFELHKGVTVKVAGFNGTVPNTESTRHLYSTGTSQPNQLVVTDNMTACIAVACASENFDPYTGNSLPGAKVRVFHLLPFVHDELMPDEVLASIRDYIEEIKQQGLTMRVAMHGGDADGGISTGTARALQFLFAQQNVPIEFDETCENRLTNTPLGAVIRDDHSVQFVTQIVAV
ncbi:XopAF/AvrXv3 family type III secretion system effector [Acidovorax sp. SUPP2539]|uniref:XopAF/AvrXv3 family type III secretion system effector n=1 Tax=Acidovorax sp. SUPP2539 TaxID=2920878 RepID=UPI0023DE2C6F|nr:XopAF/AvrXv3 family type III secretion system effector [Acidovorax sp. SUPP2539]GKS92654.1 avirulence protein AvrXv3 [Acidovorax sp. SUPP2539]